MSLLLHFFILLLSLPAFSNELSGTTWALSGVGCRDASLSSSSHISKLSTSADVTAGVIHFKDESRVHMTTTVQGGEESRRGNYDIIGDKVILENGQMQIHILGERLIIIGSRTESAKECCNLKFLERWREYKESIETAQDPHPDGTWEEQKTKNDWDENWLAGDSEEYEKLKDKCQRERPFVYVLGKV